MKENIVYKGCERRVIVVKSASSKHFEEAHFFIRTGEPDDQAPPDMPALLREANRIVEQSLISPNQQKKKAHRRWFLRGFGIGSLLTIATFCLLYGLVMLFGLL